MFAPIQCTVRLTRYRSDFPEHVGNCSITIICFDGKAFALEQLAAGDHLGDELGG
jgi:hypothetical protein